MAAMAWDPARFRLLVACFGVAASEITTRAGLSRQAAWALERKTSEPTRRTLKALSDTWKVEKHWLEEGEGPSGLPLPPGLRAIVEAHPSPDRWAAVIYAVTAGGGELLNQGRAWTTAQWEAQLEKLEIPRPRS